MGSFESALEGTRDGILEVAALGLSHGSTDDEALGTDEVIILDSTGGELLGSTLGVAYGITLGPDKGTVLVSSDGSLDG